jgi:hypothetical protein
MMRALFRWMEGRTKDCSGGKEYWGVVEVQVREGFCCVWVGYLGGMVGYAVYFVGVVFAPCFLLLCVLLRLGWAALRSGLLFEFPSREIQGGVEAGMEPLW